MGANDLRDVPLSPGLSVNLRAMHDNDLPVELRLSAALSVSVNVNNYTAYLARTARVSGKTWDEIAAPLQISRQTAYARYGESTPILHMVTGVHPDRNAVWYGLEGDLPHERSYAHTRNECPAAYAMARARAEALAAGIGPHTMINDGGIDRGQGTFWDLYIGA
jgi:hypothetical protein